MRFSRSQNRHTARSRHHANTSQLGVEPLEDRRMLAAFELSNLLAAGGGDGSAGFVAVGVNEYSNGTNLQGDVNGDGYTDLLVSDEEFNTIDQPKGPRNEKLEGAVFVVFGTADGIPPEVDLLSLDGTNGFTVYGNPEDAVDGNGGTIASLGQNLASGRDLNGDGVDDILIAAPLADPAGQGILGRVYVLFGDPTWGSAGTPAVVELEDLTAARGGNGTAGFVVNRPDDGNYSDVITVALDGDVNADGVDDLVIGSEFSLDTAGQAFVLYGKDTDVEDDGVLDNPFSAEISLGELDGSNGFTINGNADTDYTGNWVSAGGDLNGDGIDDIVVAARSAWPDSQRDSAGQIFVLYGATSFPTTLQLSDILAADGTDGFVINGIRGNTDEGGTFVSGDRAGITVHSGGDFNGDGVDDLAIGASRAANASGTEEVGEAYVVFGRGPTDAEFPVALELADLDGANGVTIRGLDEEDSFGRHVALANVNGDAHADLIVTAPGGDPDGRTDAGETYVVYGSPDIPVGGVLNTLAIAIGDGTTGFVINGINPEDSTGGGRAFASRWGQGLGLGDFNGDGTDDVTITTYFGPPETYVVFGGSNIIPPPPAPSFSIDDIEVTEGDSGTGTVAHNTPSARYCTVRVYYPFHPLNGRDLKLLRPYKKSTESVVVVDPVDRRLVIPKWMTLPESATCRVSTTATLNARALYAIAELVELHSDNNTPQ